MKHLQLLSLIALFAFNASAQNVGIGTPIPSDQLHTTGTVRFENYKGFNTRTVQMDASGRLLVPGPLFSNTTAQAIPDNGCSGGNGITSQINVFSQNTAVPSAKIAVRLNISHPFVGDLLIYLYPPSGGGVLVLAAANGSGGDNFTNTTFTDQAAGSIDAGTAPFTGQYKPKGGPVACFQSGTPLATFGAFGSGNILPNGIWSLRVLDAFLNDVGTLNSWSISFTGPESFTAADESDYIPKFSDGNLVPSNIYQQPPPGINSGNIGIRTTNPTASLEIAGTMKIEKSLPTNLMEVTNATGNGLLANAPLSFAVRAITGSGTGLYAEASTGTAVEAFALSGIAGLFRSGGAGLAIKTSGKAEINGQLKTNGNTEINGQLSTFNVSSSGNAGFFVSNNSSNSDPVILASSAVTNGFGSAIRGSIPSTTGTVADNIGVLGEITGSNPKGIGVKGSAINATGVLGETETGSGVQGIATTGTGIYGSGNGLNGTGGYFIGRNGAIPLNIFNQAGGDIALFKSSSASTNKARIDGTGKGFFNGGTQTGGADVAEAFAVEGNRHNYEPGDVLVISTKTDRTVAKSADAYSTLVAGVYATKPGVLLTERMGDESQNDLVPMGVVGVIPTKVCSEGGAIHRGDLLVTSSIPGHAMKGAKGKIDFGTVIGKALEDFVGGQSGIIKVLVNVK